MLKQPISECVSVHFSGHVNVCEHQIKIGFIDDCQCMRCMNSLENVKTRIYQVFDDNDSNKFFVLRDKDVVPQEAPISKTCTVKA
jgi:hypothetical protein